MARKGISFDQVSNAATAIQARGMEPTVGMIRNELGTGSFTTISQHLARWKADRIAAGAVEVVRTMPEELENALMEMGSAFFGEVSRDAERKILAARQECADKVREAEGKEAAYKQEVEDLQQELDEVRAAMEKLQMDNNNKDRRIAALDAENKARVAMFNELSASLKQQPGKTKAAQPTKSTESESKQA